MSELDAWIGDALRRGMTGPPDDSDLDRWPPGGLGPARLCPSCHRRGVAAPMPIHDHRWVCERCGCADPLPGKRP